MEATREMIESDDHVHTQRKNFDSVGADGLEEPGIERDRQVKTSARVKHLALPHADRRDGWNVNLGRSIDGLALGVGQLLLPC